MTTHLVIPDSHAQPGVSNDRFTWLGKYIVEVQPDVIINIGDMADMKSLAHYDQGTRSAEGRRYKDDIAAVNDALSKLMAPIYEYNKKQKKLKRKQYTPRLVFCMGNHEERIVRAANEDPKFYGTIGLEDIKLEEHGWEVVPFCEPAIIDDIAYAHYAPSGVMMRPIGGVNHARRLLATQYMSSTVGHSHLRDFSEQSNSGGRKFNGLVVGCYFEHHEGWAKNANKMYWRGIVLKKNVVEGTYDPEFISIEELKEEYG